MAWVVAAHTDACRLFLRLMITTQRMISTCAIEIRSAGRLGVRGRCKPNHQNREVKIKTEKNLRAIEESVRCLFRGSGYWFFLQHGRIPPQCLPGVRHHTLYVCMDGRRSCRLENAGGAERVRSCTSKVGICGRSMFVITSGTFLPTKRLAWLGTFASAISAISFPLPRNTHLWPCFKARHYYFVH
ncbi:hypothetical protein LZ31DRAFT_196371 [Colletotrichum somersetense]|nr:hypothetical protein LZ31DRAFT_196371 [Colletotrichum somersetense]